MTSTTMLFLNLSCIWKEARSKREGSSNSRFDVTVKYLVRTVFPLKQNEWVYQKLWMTFFLLFFLLFPLSYIVNYVFIFFQYLYISNSSLFVDDNWYIQRVMIFFNLKYFEENRRKVLLLCCACMEDEKRLNDGELLVDCWVLRICIAVFDNFFLVVVSWFNIS